MKKLLIIPILLGNCLFAQASQEQSEMDISKFVANANDYSIDREYSDMIENSPYKNVPQNKNLNNTLKTKNVPIKNQENNQTKTPSSQNQKPIITKYKFHIDNEGETFESLKVSEEELQELLIDFRTKKFEIKDLQDISNIISYFFQINGYPSATAYVPQQELTDSIQVNIALGVLGKYIINNQTGTRDYAIESKLNQKLKGKIITIKTIEDSVYRVNEMYGVEALAALQAGENYGETDIVINVEQTQKVSAMVYGDNYGSQGAGIYRGGINVTFNNVARQGDSGSVFLQRSDEQQTNYGISYTTFYGNFKVTTGYSQGSYALGGELEDMGISGTSKDLTVNVSYPVFLTTTASLYLTSGFAYRDLKDYMMIWGFWPNDTFKHSFAYKFGIEGTYNGLSNNNFSYSAIITHGTVIGDNDNVRYANQQQRFLGQFAKLNVNINNSYFFHPLLTHVATISYQQVINGAKLDSSETMSLGGPYGVRAYRNGEADRDNAIIGNFGLRFTSPIPNFYITPFYDIGYAWFNKHAYGDDLFMDAFGLELLYIKPGSFYAKLDAARALHTYEDKDLGVKDGKPRARIYFSAGKYF